MSTCKTCGLPSTALIKDISRRSFDPFQYADQYWSRSVVGRFSAKRERLVTLTLMQRDATHRFSPGSADMPILQSAVSLRKDDSGTNHLSPRPVFPLLTGFTNAPLPATSHTASRTQVQ